ncbi:MAG TPA: DUF2254 domain-containing protein, partial [Roseiarcus sp.]|nr:DUF2254 domain-containing protein [Roseiarcus sp.]
VFAMAFVMVQFSAIAYSPRLVLWFARDPILFHALGAFGATFLYALFTLAWVDRGGSGNVPLFSSLIVGLMMIASMLLFARLMQRLSDLQISSVLHLIGDRGREAIRDMFAGRAGAKALGRPPSAQDRDALAPPALTLKYSGRPLTIARFDVDALVRQAEQANAIIVMLCAVGDTLVEGATLLRVHGGGAPLSERALRDAIRLGRERTFEQDPKYPIRLLVDVAIRALSPAVNDPTTAVQTIDQIEDLLRRLGRSELDAGYGFDRTGKLRLVVPMPTWEDYLALAFDEIRQYGATSVQVMRRLRSALAGLMDAVTTPERAEAVRRSLDHLDLVIENSSLDPTDRMTAREEDRQGIGLSGRREEE